MSWTNNVHCDNPICGVTRWRVINGEWRCQCGKAMSTAAVALCHQALDMQAAADA